MNRKELKNKFEEHADLVPFVIERTGSGERSYDIFSRLLKDRIIFITGPLHEGNANLFIAELLFLELENRERDIQLYINSPGGSVTAGLAIYDTIQHLAPDVCTYAVGQASSMGALLLCAGAKGKRYALPHSRIMLHQPMAGASGTAADINIQAKECSRLKSLLYDIIVKHTGQPLDKVIADCDRDYFMSAQQSMDYGIVDEVLQPAGDDQDQLAGESKEQGRGDRDKE